MVGYDQWFIWLIRGHSLPCTWLALFSWRPLERIPSFEQDTSRAHIVGKESGGLSLPTSLLNCRRQVQSDFLAFSSRDPVFGSNMELSYPSPSDSDKDGGTQSRRHSQMSDVMPPNRKKVALGEGSQHLFLWDGSSGRFPSLHPCWQLWAKWPLDICTFSKNLTRMAMSLSICLAPEFDSLVENVLVLVGLSLLPTVSHPPPSAVLYLLPFRSRLPSLCWISSESWLKPWARETPEK